MLSQKMLKKMLNIEDSKRLLKKWIDLDKKIESKQRELISSIEGGNASWALDKEEELYNYFKRQIIELINKFCLIPSPEMVWDYLLFHRIPFRIKPEIEKYIMQKKQWMKRIHQVKEGLANTYKDQEQEIIRADWNTSGVITAIAEKDRAFVQVEEYTMFDKKFYWFSDPLSKKKKLCTYKNDDLLLWLCPKIKQMDILDLTEFTTNAMPELQLLYRLKKQGKYYVLDGICSHTGECQNCQEKHCKTKRSLSPVYRPCFAIIKGDPKPYPIVEIESSSIWGKSEKQKYINASGNEEEYVSGKTWRETSQEVHAKKQKVWCFSCDKPDLHIAKVIVQPSKEAIVDADYISNIFSLPPIVPYSQAKEMLHSKTYFYRLHPLTKRDDVKRGYREDDSNFGGIQKAIEQELADLNTEEKKIAESNCFLIPFSSECSIKKTLQYWPIVQTAQSLYTARKKSITQYTKIIGEIIEKHCQTSNKEIVTIKSIQKKIDKITEDVYAIVSISSLSKRNTKENQYIPLPAFCSKAQREIRCILDQDKYEISMLEPIDEDDLETEGENVKRCKVINLCNSYKKCKFSDCPLRKKKQKISIELFDFAEEELFRIYKRYKKAQNARSTWR
ncbi:MAG: hypothetical protein HUU50_04285 [Candidatus Brocadiae bacterium]|nr:hypothetical protein [Candidatus Brocadiia bacterium]